MTTVKTLPKWIKSWCCQAVAVRFAGGELRCKTCGILIFDNYYQQKLIIDGEPYDATETIPYPRGPR